MTYVDGFLLAVPDANRDAYRQHAAEAWPMFRERGALTMVEGWDDEVPDGTVNSFHTAVLRRPDEAVVFSWINWPDRAARDAAWERVLADPRLERYSPRVVGADLGRMIFGSFVPLVDL